MRFNSTRDVKQECSFAHAIIHCMPSSGGMYVPSYTENIRPWINHMNEKTSFSAIAGSLTSALLKDDFSPSVCEAIAQTAFSFEPQLKQLDENLFTFELFHGPTFTHKDFGISYLASCLEHAMIINESNCTVLAVTAGETGASITHALKNKKHLKAILLYPKGCSRGYTESDCIWNGGNIYPVEVNGTLADCFALAQEVLSDNETVTEHRLTLANTVNIGRLFPHIFFYTHAFLQLRQKVYGDIYYALTTGNYSNIVGGLYGWKFSLPVNGFITDTNNELTVSKDGKCILPLIEQSFQTSEIANLANPSNLERLAEVFNSGSSMLQGLLFPAAISDKDELSATKELYEKYGTFADKQTARAYAATKNRVREFGEELGAMLLFSRYHPASNIEALKQICGTGPDVPKEFIQLQKSITPHKIIEVKKESIIDILKKDLK